MATLLEDAVILYEEGVLRDEQRLRRLKNLAVARMPAARATEAILGVILEIQGRNGGGRGMGWSHEWRRETSIVESLGGVRLYRVAV